jgi:hypothetical protein
MHNDTAAKLECCTGFSGGTEVTGEGLKVWRKKHKPSCQNFEYLESVLT